MSEVIPTRIVRKATAAPAVIVADMAVLGAGISGVSAALEGARLGRRVVLIDGAPKIGGQAIGSIIGTLIGLYTHGPDAYRITGGIASEMVADLTAEGAMFQRRSVKTGTITFQYDEVKMQRWIERKLTEAGVTILVGATMTAAVMAGRRMRHVELATRYGTVRVEATGFVDASGDAALCWEAGLPTREPEAPIYGSMNFLIENYDLDAVKELSMPDVAARLRAEGADYGLVRHEGFLMHMPGMNVMLANITHFETPLDPVAAAAMVIEGHAQGDAVLRFLKDKFSAIFADARVRVYGNPGIRQTRWIVGRQQLKVADIRAGLRPSDAVARSAWWVELHDTREETSWEAFPDNHVYFIPLGCMVPAAADNIVAAGRCVDADSHALSAIRVMGPCMAMGVAAAHALDLAGTGSLAQLDHAELQQRLSFNLDGISA
ncbi:MAG: FAD-dependent oxidoreductase [Blastomonas fulva]|uniref:FAD-dependent oxidoreductase n=1 Tax=Blastomonas fulva TaxID=1550728 RepID=UPI004034F440